MPLRVVIVDDEPLAVDILADYVRKTEGLVLEEATTDVFKALALVQKGQIDLVLLDVQMPELTGLQFMKIIGNQSRVILTTAYTEYALEGYEFNIIDYLPLIKNHIRTKFMLDIKKSIAKIPFLSTRSF